LPSKTIYEALFYLGESDEALSTIRELIADGELEQALAVAETIEPPAQKSRALIAIAEGFIYAGDKQKGVQTAVKAGEVTAGIWDDVETVSRRDLEHAFQVSETWRDPYLRAYSMAVLAIMWDEMDDDIVTLAWFDKAINEAKPIKDLGEGAILASLFASALAAVNEYAAFEHSHILIDAFDDSWLSPVMIFNFREILLRLGHRNQLPWWTRDMYVDSIIGILPRL